MATKTPNLGLILPANGEFFNTWDQPMNFNLTTIDTAIGNVEAEIEAARGTQPDLNTRLSVSLNADGSLIASPEAAAARVSSIYGGFLQSGPAFELNDRLEAGDREVFDARQALPGLIDSLAWGPDQNKDNCVLSAANNYLTYTGAVVSLNGSVTPMIANINGYRQAVRTIKTTTISGGVGTYYLTLTRTAGGVIYLTVAGQGSISTYAGNGLLAKFTDTTTNFIASGVKVGDVLNITGPALDPNIDRYVVLATNNEDAVNLTVNDVAIYGQFKAASASLDYTFTNQVDATLGFTSTAHAKSFTRVADKIYLGRCGFDGTNVTSLIIYQSLGVYSGFTSISLLSGNFSSVVSHNLGYFPSKIHFYGSQANDFSQPLEPLSVSALSSGSQTLLRSVIAKADDLTISVKNATNGVFYQDFGGTSQTSGYLYIVAER